MRFVVGKADEIPPGSRKIVRVAGRSIGVFNVAGEYYAIRNRCPHQGAPLCEGKLWGALKSDLPGTFEYNETKDIIACIQHGWEFSLRTGQSWCDPKRLRVRSYQVDVQEPEAVGADTPAAQMDTVKNPLIVTANPRPTDPTIPLGTRVDRVGAVDAKETVEDDEAPPAPGMVKGPYAVETFPVTVEGGYLYLVIDVVDVAASPPSRNEVRAAR
jgi:3-phenylpropionate/trans-cinnamate dioxygenase ferredoxin subunit